MTDIPPPKLCKVTERGAKAWHVWCIDNPDSNRKSVWLKGDIVAVVERRDLPDYTNYALIHNFRLAQDFLFNIDTMFSTGIVEKLK